MIRVVAPGSANATFLEELFAFGERALYEVRRLTDRSPLIPVAPLFDHVGDGRLSPFGPDKA